jgi:hypothetical protein
VRAGEPLNVNGFWHGQPQEPSVFLTARRPSNVGAGLLDGLEDATQGLLGEFRHTSSSWPTPARRFKTNYASLDSLPPNVQPPYKITTRHR